MKPFNAQQILEEQDALLREKKWRLALEHAQTAAAQFPENIQTWELVDRLLYRRSNEIDDIERLCARLGVLDQMLKLNPEDKRDVYLQADYLSGLQYEKFAVLCRLAKETQDPEYLRSSWVAFDNSIALSYNNTELIQARNLQSKKDSILLFINGLDEVDNLLPWIEYELFKTLDQLIAYGNKDWSVEAAYDKGRYCKKGGKWEQAYSAFSQALTLEWSPLGILSLASCLLRLGRFDECQKNLDEINEDPTQSDKKILQCCLWAKTGHNQDAITLLASLLGEKPWATNLWHKVTHIAELEEIRKDKSIRELIPKGFTIDLDSREVDPKVYPISIY
jgi:tetratricopeptide (TPR) repeat protein